jgi:hypothetical protein
MFATDANLHRYDPWDAMAWHNIFRDPWERRIPDIKPEELDVCSTSDYPELGRLFSKVQDAVDSIDCPPPETLDTEIGAASGIYSLGNGTIGWRCRSGSPPFAEPSYRGYSYSPSPPPESINIHQTHTGDEETKETENSKHEDSDSGEVAGKQAEHTRGFDRF